MPDVGYRMANGSESARGRVEPAGLHRRASHAWVFDTVHSSIHFSVRRMLVGRVRGQFTKWHGSMAFDPARPEATSISVRIDARSIDTGDAERDEHLRSPDFLDAEHHRHIAFDSARIELLPDGRFALAGVLEIRGVAEEVVLATKYLGLVRDRWGNDHVRFAATTRIQRGPFGLVWNEMLPTGELFVGEEIEISIAIEATRLPQRPS
jgi:polyisoprenoid-binding protein YceI